MILITGGLGYIGSHMAAMLLTTGHEVILVDNLCNSSMNVLERLEHLAGRYITFIRMDICNTPALQRTIEQYQITALIHCAGNKSIRESFTRPLDFYNNNLTATSSVLRAMQRSQVKRLLFCSSLAVKQAQLNPYTKSLSMAEQIVTDVVQADAGWRVMMPRYANINGAWPTGIIGEFSQHLNSNLIHQPIKVAQHAQDSLIMFGDGSAKRDFIHVMDVVEANMQMLSWLYKTPTQAASEIKTFDVCTGTPTSIKQFILAFERVTNLSIPTVMDKALLQEAVDITGDVQTALEVIHWQAKRSLDSMIQDTWKFSQALSTG